ncbi:hypothetical protein BYT27DRAFT_6373090 [Phlegmacium glaucopus]|nr:hypothetical protein BYT27DRAFT_6373090 [Phlegmacium glaucopus]
MDIGPILDLYAIKLLSFISVNLLVTVFVIRSFSAPVLKHLYVTASMDTPDSKPSDSNLNLSLTVSSTGSTLSHSSLNDLGRRSITPDLISSGSTSGSSSSSNTTISSYGSSASGKCFRMSNANFQQDGSRRSESGSPYHTTFGGPASQNTPPIIISPPRQEQLIDGSTPSPSPVSERIPQGLRTSLAQRLLSLVDSDGRPIRLVKRSVLKDITNIVQTRSSVPGDDECIDDAQCLVYRSAEEFLPAIVSTPPTFNAPYSDSAFFGSSGSRFGDMFSPNAPPSITPTFALPESFKLSNFAGSITRISGDIVTSLAAKYQNEYPDDDGVVIGEEFEWEDEMRSLEMRLAFYDKAT